MTNRRPIHVWVSGLEETGGIQHYSQACIRTLQELAPERGVAVWSMNDAVASGLGIHAFGQYSGWQRTLRFCFSGLRAALRERPAFVFTTHPHFMKALWPLPKLGISCLSAAHGVEVWGKLEGPLGAALRSASGLLSVSKYTQERLIAEGRISPERLCVVPNTFREKAFTPVGKSLSLMERYGLTNEQPVLLTIARLSEDERYKGQDQTLIALPEILKHFPKLRYLIGGCGADELRLRRLAAELGVSNSVTFTGYVPDDELADHYRLADLYVMPSTGEGFGIVYLESLACGRPCLVGNRDASPEAIDDGRLGLVVDPRDPREIARGVIDFLSRQHDKPWLHDPQFLHDQVLRLFGHAAFRTHLDRALRQLVPGVLD